MSEDQLKAFLKAVKDNVDLQEQLKTTTGDPHAFLAAAKAAGFSITEDALKEVPEASSKDLTDEELEGVTGGVWYCSVLRRVSCNEA